MSIYLNTFTFARDQNNAVSIDETIKEKMETFLSNNETRVERLKFDDEKSLRETLVKDAGKDDASRSSKSSRSSSSNRKLRSRISASVKVNVIEMHRQLFVR